MQYLEGKFTIETYAKKRELTINSALNEISKLKKEGRIKTSGGGKQKRIYTITKIPEKTTNGFYNIVNKYSKEKLNEKFKHYVYGKYTIENAIIQGIKIGDSRTKEATMELFRHVKDWKKLMHLAKKKNKLEELYELYEKAKNKTKVKKIPKKYV